MRSLLATLLAFLLATTACTGGAADGPNGAEPSEAPTTNRDGSATSGAAASEQDTSTTTVAGATTSVATSPDAHTEPPADPGARPPAEGTIGYVGCSVSQNAVAGYGRILGGTRMWSGGQPYGGGSIGRWERDIDSSRSRYWQGFDDALSARPDTTAIWYSLCTIRGAPGDSVEAASSVVAEIRSRIPDVPIFVSAQPPYSGDHVCDLAGETGPQKMAAVAAELVALGLAQPGPAMEPLAASETADGCHANEIGQEKMGRRLLEFFG